MWHLYGKVVHGNQSANHCNRSDTHHLYTTIRASLANTQLPSLLENTHAHIYILSVSLLRLFFFCFEQTKNSWYKWYVWLIADPKKKKRYMLILTSKKCWKLLVNAKPRSLNCTHTRCISSLLILQLQDTYRAYAGFLPTFHCRLSKSCVFFYSNSNLTDYSPTDL